MSFSLIVATYGRTEPLDRLLKSLELQTYNDFELIIVDQNLDERLSPVVAPYQRNMRIKHIRSALGSSRARNVGIAQASHDLLMFPDDDCWYPAQLLEQVFNIMQDKQLSGLCFRACDENHHDIARFARKKGYATVYSIWTQVCCYTMCLRKSIVNSVGGFDENLGIASGTDWKAAEDIDLPIQILKRGSRMLYLPELVAFHPNSSNLPLQAQIQRAQNYNPAVGHLWNKHSYPFWFCLYHLLRPAAGMIAAALKGKMGLAQVRWHVFLGRLHGWTSNTSPIKRKNNA